MAGVTVPPVIELEISESCSGAVLFGDPSFNDVSFPCRRPLTLKSIDIVFITCQLSDTTLVQIT